MTENERMTDRQMRNLMGRGYTTIPNGLLRSRAVGLTAKVVYSVLGRVSGGKDHAFPRVELIAKEIGGVALNTVRAAIRELAKAGFIEVQARPQRTNLYFFLQHPAGPGLPAGRDPIIAKLKASNHEGSKKLLLPMQN